MSKSSALPLHIVLIKGASSAQALAPVVMLHGWGHSSESLRPLAELIAEERSVYLVDLPGFGASPPPPTDGEAWGTEEYAECLCENLRNLGLGKVVLFGTSFGGRVSLRVATKYPDLLEGVILLNSHGLKRSYPLSKQLRIVGIRYLRSLIKTVDSLCGTSIFQNWFVPKFASADYRSAGPLKPTFIKTVNEDQEQNVRGIQLPVFLLWGELDTEAPVEFCERFYRLIPGAQSSQGAKVIVPLAGHLFYLGSGSYLAASFILPWLRRLSFQPTAEVSC